jgi:hypothetical protein
MQAELEASRHAEVAAAAGAVAGEAVAAATDGQLQPRLAREFHDARDVGGVGDPDDDCGAALVEPL